MPKDKKTKEKDGSSSSKEAEVPKRKSSVVDSSGGSSSSSAASDNSGNTSDHSGSGDSDSSAGFDEKGTMTGENGQGSSSGGGNSGSHCSVDIRDRTEEMRRLMNENADAEKKPIKVVDKQNDVPVSDDTHLVPIDNESSEREDGETSPTPSSRGKNALQNQPSTSNKQTAKNVKEHKKPKQAKQLTKKQKKELEKRELEKQTGVILFPGQQNNGKSKKPVEMLMNNEQELHVHHFNEWTGDDIQDGEMIVRGRNAAAQSLLGNKVVPIPFYRKEETLGAAMTFTDLHKNSQMRYLRYVNSVGQYTGIPASIKPIHRMGYGIAASGIPDTEPLMLTVAGAKAFMRYQYQDYIISGSKISNWRSEFISSVDKDRASQDHSYVEVMIQLKKIVDDMTNTAVEKFHKGTMLAMRDGELRDLLLRFGEVERTIMRQEQTFREIGVGVTARYRRFDALQRKLRINYVAAQVIEWCTSRFLEKNEEGGDVVYTCSMLMYLSATCPGDKPCQEDKHRKCTMLSFLLSRITEKNEVFRQKFFGGNTLLHFAAMTGSPCQIDVLLRQGAALNLLNDQFKSPIALALRRHTTLVARQLMWHGADLGGALNLEHIRPRTPRQEENKELSEYLDFVSRSIPYKAREFAISRLRAISNSFTSWVEAILVDAEKRVLLSIDSVKSSLHQVRIGVDPGDSVIRVRGQNYVKKVFEMAIESSSPQFEKEPIVLFLIPCQYTRFDTTMTANFPHIVRVPMLTNAQATATKIAEKDKERMANGEPRKEYFEELESLRPIKMLGQPVSISYGDGAVNRVEKLEPFFSSEHNGVIYGYNMAPSVCKGSSKTVPVSVCLIIPEDDSERFRNCFFMAQAVQLAVRSPPETKPAPLEFVGLPFMQGKPEDPRAAAIAEQVAIRKAEKLAEEERKRKERELQEERVRRMVEEVQSGVAQKKRERELKERAAELNEMAGSSSSSKKQSKKKTE